MAGKAKLIMKTTEAPDYSSYSMEDWEKELTNKQRIFCKEYILDWNGSRAALKAGYSKRSAKEIASGNLTKHNIKAFIKFLRGNIELSLGLSKEMVVLEHMKIAFSSIAHLHNTWISKKEFENLTEEQKACIQEIDSKVTKKAAKPKYDKDGVQVNAGEMTYNAYIKVKLYDKSKALESLSRLMGYDAPLKTENKNIDISFSDLIEQAEKKER